MKNSGFTLIETLMVIIMMGILAAIATPSWLGFIQQQRLNAAADRVYQSLKDAQSEAKSLKQSQFPQPVAPPDIDSTVVVTYPATLLQFDRRGAVGSNNLPYRIDLTVTDSSVRRCVVVRTLLGAIATGRNPAECNALSNPQ